MAPVRVKVTPVNYASVEDLAKQVAAFLSKEGKVVADVRSNTILVTDRENVIEKVDKLIKALDIQPNQVLIEGKIVEAIESFNSYMGINWSFSGFPTNLSPSGGAQGVPIELRPRMNVTPVTPTVASVMTAGFDIGTLDFFGDLNATLLMA
jgi:type IV pilus assembly protein PilQ